MRSPPFHYDELFWRGVHMDSIPAYFRIPLSSWLGHKRYKRHLTPAIDFCTICDDDFRLPAFFIFRGRGMYDQNWLRARYLYIVASAHTLLLELIE